MTLLLTLRQFLITRTPADGALNQLWVATCSDAEARKLSGEYVVPFQRIGRARPDLENPKKVDGLWRWCDAQYKRTG